MLVGASLDGLIAKSIFGDGQRGGTAGSATNGKVLGTAAVETRIRIGMRALDNPDAAVASKLPKVLVTPIVVSQH